MRITLLIHFIGIRKIINKNRVKIGETNLLRKRINII